ncbi:MAG: tetratricopeptide repeat protein [Cyanothece sp. SIO1E1]|nr:tetratricopeptide repeat protein [Cyanothece sp. SIO1E1]
MATVVSEALELAGQYRRINRLAKAKQVYQKILKEQPDQPEALYGLGMLAQQTGQHQTAENLLRTTLQLQPNYQEAWFSLGNLLQARGDFTAAIAAYQQILVTQPESAAIHNNLGYIYQQQGQFEAAIAHYQKALVIQPNCVEATVNLGNTLHAQGQLSSEQQTHYAMLNHQLGVTRQEAGDLATAIAYYRQAIALHPELAVAHYHLGVALQGQGQLEAAIACCQQALELNSNDADVYKSLGELYQARKQLKQAAAAYRQWLSLINPHYAAAVAAYQGTGVAPEGQIPPPVQLGQVTVGDYQFPTIPPVPETEEPRPFWSVIIPLYNRKDYLLECFAHVLAQWRGEGQMEILAMDNASTPPLFEWVEAIGGGIVRYYRNPENIGARRNFNLGMALSRGQWIHVLPEDEYVLPGFYDRLQQSLEACPDSVGAAFTGYENINEKRQVIFSQRHRGMQKGINPDWLGRIGVSNPLNPCAIVVRRSAHEQLGGYDPNNMYTPDWELYKRLASFYDWWHEPGILARYRQHADNMSTEVLAAGAQGESYRQGIEISESYLPIEQRAEMTAKARRHYFNSCLTQAVIPLQAGNLQGVLRLLQAALKIDGSPQTVAMLFSWLTQPEAAPLRHAIAAKLISTSWDENNTSDSFYFAYP